MPRFFITILILVGIWYGFKFLFRFLFPVLLKRMMTKLGQNQFGQFQQQQQPPSKPEGEVTISKTKKSDSKIDNNDGEYIDYEELDN